jgi:hypothetical protein
MTSDGFTAPTWKEFFLDNQDLDYSNLILSKIKAVGLPDQSDASMFFEISKNPGIGFLSLDASEDHLQLFHNIGTMGGSWVQQETKLFALTGFSSSSTAIQINPKSIKETKQKSPTVLSIMHHLSSDKQLKDIKCSKELFLYKNIIPLPIALVHTFLRLGKTDPHSVALAFYKTMTDFATTKSTAPTDLSDNPTDSSPISLPESPDELNSSETPEPSLDDETITPKMTTKTAKEPQPLPSFLQDFGHVLQFLALCAKGKISPITTLSQPTMRSSLGNVIPTNVSSHPPELPISPRLPPSPSPTKRMIQSLSSAKLP